ncbi:MAG: VWA domain-containing protein [Lentisphaerae bacterium]|nr:VWA domain-containing protein [Lentisphaerota bacterium]
MNVVFLNGSLWPLALLVLLPLAVHLFARARPRVVDFSSVAFIRRALRFTQRVRKPKDWLLLLLRTAAAAALVLLFLRPVLHSPGGGGPFARRAVVVILDASASMGWSDGSQTRFAVACAETSEILAGLASRDAVNVILAGAAPRPVLPAMGGNIGYLQEAIRRARLTAEPLDAAAAVRLAVQMLDNQEGRREICIVSDFQAANWRGLRPRLPPGIGLSGVGVARGEAPNAALLRLTVDPPRPLAGEEASLICEIANFSDAPRRETVVLAVESSRASREVVVPPWGRATAIFRQRIATAAPLTVTAALDGDVYPLDDRRWASVASAAELRAGLLSFPGGEATANAWSRACRALGWARPVAIRPEELAQPTEPLDLLLLANWDGRTAPTFRDPLKLGLPIVWSPAPGMPLARVWALMTNAAPSAAGPTVASWVEHPDGVGLTLARPDHPLFAAFAGGEFGDPARGRVRGYLSLAAAQLPPGDTLMAYGDGTPALWLGRTSPPVLLWNIPLDADHSTFQSQGEFVPLVGELLLHLRRGVPDAVDTGDVAMPGRPLVYQAGIETRFDDVQLLDAEGQPLAVQADPGRGLVIAEAPTRPGIHVWTIGDQPVAHEAVNFPSVESDLRSLSDAEIKALGMLAAASGRDMRLWQAGVPLWPRLLWLAMALLLVEAVVQFTIIGRDRARPSSFTEPAGHQGWRDDLRVVRDGSASAIPGRDGARPRTAPEGE